MRRCSLLITMFSLLVLAAGCASTPVFDTDGVDQSLTPRNAVAQADRALGTKILWGGTILDIRNLSDSTQIEVLAYPLNKSKRPLIEQPPLGRFLLREAGFLEPASFAQGRYLTVLGQVQSLAQGRIGDSDYRYPVVQAQQISLWPRPGTPTRSNVIFGIGISFQN